MWYEKYDTRGILLFIINPDLYKFTSTEKNIILFNVITDYLFLLNYMALYLGYLLVQDAKVITTGMVP